MDRYLYKKMLLRKKEINEVISFLRTEERGVLSESINKISQQFAVDNGFFGPVYHGTTPENFLKISNQGFKVFVGDPRFGDIRNGYIHLDYGHTGYPPPIHHLGFGVYFTTSKSNAKKFNLSSTKNLKSFYLDIPRLEVINFASPKNMMKWWIENCYDPELAKRDRVLATKQLTDCLKDKYDAVWFKGKGLGTLLDGDQVVIFNPNKIFLIDESLSGEMEIGSKVKATKDKIDWRGNIRVKGGAVGIITSKQEVNTQMTWAGDSKYVYTVRFKPGGLVYNIIDSDIETFKKT